MEKLKNILVIADSERILALLKEYVQDQYNIVGINHFDLDKIDADNRTFEYILIDYLILNDFKIRKNDENFYQKKLASIQHYFPSIRVIVLADSKFINDASSLLAIGYNNIIQIPFSKEILNLRLKVETERTKLKTVFSHIANLNMPHEDLFKSNNKSFSNEIAKLREVAKSRSTILITGESGTGKSLLAKYIHSLSGRQEHPFIEVHCGAITETLIESELFGHEKGAFTGAIKRKIGKFELADKGTIFLDEIGTVSKGLQVKLLQVLQERFITRVGGEGHINLDIRVVAATNQNLKEMVLEHDFREDLYYRLNVFQIEVPPLRERKEDLEDLCIKILAKLNKTYNKGIEKLSHEVLHVFKDYSWPGNVRELENILERSYILEGNSQITLNSIPAELISINKEVLAISPLKREKLGLVDARKEATIAFEKKYLNDLLLAHHGKVTEMAKEAQVSTRQLHKLLAKHDIKSKQFH